MIKRDDGIVYIDQEKCIGYMACSGACPWTIPQRNPETNKALNVITVWIGLMPA